MSWQNNRHARNDMYNPPFVVPVQVPDFLSDFIPAFTGYVLDWVTQTASKNKARALFLDLAQHDDRIVVAMVQDLATATEFYVESQNIPTQRIEAVIRDTTGKVVDAHMAMAVSRYREDFRQYLSQEMMDDTREYIETLEDLKAQAREFFRGGQRNDWREDDQRRGWSPNDRRDRGRGGGRQSRSSGSHYRSAADDDWPGNRVAPRQGSGRESRQTVWNNLEHSDTPTSTTTGARPRRDFTQQVDVQPTTQRRMEKIVPNQTVVDGIAFVPIRSDKEWPKVKDVQRRYDHVLLEDGTQMRPAHLSDWKITFDPQTPVIPWYDPATSVLFHLKFPNGKVSAAAITRDEYMNYYEHELDPKLRATVKADEDAKGPAAVPTWKLIETLQANPSSPLATSGPINDDDTVSAEHIVTVGLPESYQVTTSLQDGVKRACLRLKVDKPELMKKPFEIYLDRAELTTVLNPDFDRVTEIANAESFQSLHALLMAHDLNNELADEIDRRVVAAINFALQKHMGLKRWSITSFREDFADLLSALDEDYGKGVSKTLCDNAIETISRFLAFFKPEELEAVRSVLGLDEGTQLLVWRERSSVTRMPITSTEAKIPNDTGVLLSREINPEMYATLDSIFDRTQDRFFTYHGRYLTFSDGVTYLLVRGYFNEESILVFKTNDEL